MPKKEVVADFKDHQIRVVNTWLGGAKLYIDGDCRDTCNDFFAKSGTPSLSASIEHNGEKVLIEVYIKAIVTVKIKICANGTQIGGEPF